MRGLAIFSAEGGLAAALAPPPHSAPAGPPSAWHSPVPYLFGGLAAMIGLIAIALLILACSYWALSGDLDSGAPAAARHEKPREDDDDDDAGKDPAFEERFLVIMPGDRVPSALAIPINSRAATAGSNTDKIPGGNREPPDRSAHLSRSEQRI